MNLARSTRAVAVAAMAGGALAAQAAPFFNGSLESAASGFIETVAAGATANGWSVSSANVEFVRSGYSASGDTVAAAHDGLWMVDLNGTQGPGTISQTFDTVPGQLYLVEYWISGNAGPNGSTSGGSKSLEVAWNGAVVDTATYLHQAGDNWANLRWEGHAVVVQAAGATSTLAFRSTSLTYAAAGPLLDDIRVSAIPEPATALLWLTGFGLLAATARKRGR